MQESLDFELAYYNNKVLLPFNLICITQELPCMQSVVYTKPHENTEIVRNVNMTDMIAHSLPLSYLVSAKGNVQHCLRHERIVSGPQFTDVRLHDFVLQSQEHVFMSKTLLKRRDFNVSLKILPYLGFLPT